MAILKILLLTVVVFVGGSLWFSKLFGKTWMKIHHDKDKSPEEIKKDMNIIILTMRMANWFTKY